MIGCFANFLSPTLYSNLFSVQAQAEKHAQEAKLLQDAMDKEKSEMASRMEALQNKIKEDSNKFSAGNESLKKDNQKLLEQMEKERQELGNPIF